MTEQREWTKVTDDQIDEVAKIVADWICYKWDGLGDRDISAEYPDWTHAGGKMQGGKPAIRKLVRRILPALIPAEPPVAVALRPWGWVIPRGGKKKPVILDADSHDEISAICEEEIHGLGYFPLYATPPTADLQAEVEKLREAHAAALELAMKRDEQVVTLVAKVNSLADALTSARYYVEDAVLDDGGIDACDIVHRHTLEKIDEVLASKEPVQ